MVESKSKEDVIAELDKLIRWTREELDNECCVLYQLFLDHDESLDGRIDEEELEVMLKEFDPTATEARHAKYKAMLLPEGDHHEQSPSISFIDMCMWWHTVKNAPPADVTSDAAKSIASPTAASAPGTNAPTEGLAEEDKPGAYLSTMLQARYMAQLTGRMTLGMLQDDKVKVRMKEASMDALNEALSVYRATLYQLKSWNAQQRKDDYYQAELTKRNDAVGNYKEKGEPFSAVDKRNLLFLFDSLCSSKGRLKVTNDLPQMCAILKYDVPLSVLEATQKVYGQDFLTFDQFVLWWAGRPESGSNRWNALLG